ncbi:MAG: fibronectin type III domain-containing protein, partial [Thermomicrobiales bacterium]
PQEAGDLSIAGMRAAGCGSIGWELGQSAAGLFFRNPISTVSFGTTLATNVWTHIGVTHAGGTMRLYINGSEVASGAYTTASFAALPLQFGHPGGCAGASALVDEAQIFSRQLDATEVQVLGERPPAPSTMTAAQRTSTSLDLSWASVANVQRYIVWRGLSAGATTLYTSVPPTPAFTADHLMADTTYFWRVQSVRNNLISEPSSEASAMTFPPPNPPSGLTATPISSTRINLSWTAEPRATKYFINESVNGGPFVRKTSSVGTAIQIANLQPNTMYSYTVQTFDTGLLTSSPSTPVGATTLP